MCVCVCVYDGVGDDVERKINKVAWLIYDIYRIE